MENLGFKGLLLTLWQRVVLSYKSTLIGIAIYAFGFIGQYVIDVLTHSSNKTLATAGVIVGSIFVLIKDNLTKKYPAPPPEAAAPAP